MNPLLGNTPTIILPAATNESEEQAIQEWYKPAIESQTITAALVVIIMNLAAIIGWTFDKDQVTAIVTALVTIVGCGYVIYRRRYHTETRVKGILQAPIEKQDERHLDWSTPK